MMYDGPELARTSANHAALSPISILKRIERVRPELPAQVHARSGVIGERSRNDAKSLPPPSARVGSEKATQSH